MQQSTRLLAALAGFASLVAADCARDNCLRAVVASAFTPPCSGIPDCNSFMLSTVIPATSISTVTVTATATDAVTVTNTAVVVDTAYALAGTDTITGTATATVTGPAVTVTTSVDGVLKRRGAAAVTVHPSVMPVYAVTACKADTPALLTSRYLYACSCVGATPSVTTLAAPVTTVTVTSTLATVTATVATNTVSTTVTTTLPTTATTFVTVTNTATVPGSTVVSTTRGCSNPSNFYLQVVGPARNQLVGRYLVESFLPISIGNTMTLSTDSSQAMLFSLVGGTMRSRAAGGSGFPSGRVYVQDNGFVYVNVNSLAPLNCACTIDSSNLITCSGSGYSLWNYNSFNQFVQLSNNPSTPLQIKAVCSL